MRDIAGLLTIAFNQAHDLSESVMNQDCGSQWNLSDQLGDAAVPALAHVAAATAAQHGDTSPAALPHRRSAATAARWVSSSDC